MKTMRTVNKIDNYVDTLISNYPDRNTIIMIIIYNLFRIETNM